MCQYLLQLRVALFFPVGCLSMTPCKALEEKSISSSVKGGAVLSGWLPVYDTL